MLDSLKRASRWLLMKTVRAYQVAISPLFPPCCRFYPSCSAYAMEAIEQFGAFRGMYLAIARLARCHPFCRGGVDLVPESFSWRPWSQDLRESSKEAAPA